MFNMSFLARVSGTFLLHLEDDMGLVSTRLLEVRALPDPAPAVELLRPSRSQDSFDILPQAEITLKYQVDDPIFAIRSIYVDYRIRRFQSEVVDAGRLDLYDHELYGKALPRLFVNYSPDLRLRPQHLEGGRRWALSSLKLKEGDVLALQVCADDFDDVTALKQPGQSHEIELRVVSKNALEIAINEQQAQIQQELLRLKKQQQEAIDKVLPAETRLRTTGERLKPEELDELMQAEQLQQQVRARVGTKEEGLRAEAAKVLQTLKDNQLPRNGTQDRMESVANELDRLARQELEQIEPQLTEARKQNEIGTMPTDPKANPKANSKPNANPDSRANSRTDPKTNANSKTDPKANANSKADPKADPKSAANATAKTDPKATPNANAKSEPQVAAKPDPNANSQSNPKAAANGEAKADLKSDPKRQC